MQEQKQKNVVGQYPAIFMTWTPRHFPNKRNKSAGQGLSSQMNVNFNRKTNHYS